MESDSTIYVEVKTPVAAAIIEAPELPQHPMETASWLSIFLISWMDGLIARGARTPLQENDVWPLRSEDTAAGLSTVFATEWAKEKTTPTPRFHKALWRAMQRESLFTIGLYFLYSFLMLIQPIVIKSLLQFIQGKPTSLGIESGYALAALLTILSFVSVTVVDFGQYLSSNLGCNAKSIIMDAVYQKILRLSGFSKQRMTSGEIVTLSAVDSERVFQGYLLGPWTWASPISVLAIFTMIGFEVGWLVGLVGGVFMNCMLIVGYYSAKTVGDCRRRLLAVQSERVKLTNELLQGVRVVKMYAWESHIEAQIARVRAEELVFLNKYQTRRVFNTIALNIAPVICLAICLVTYVALGNALTPDSAFAVLAYMNVARLPSMSFSNSILFVQEALASCDRITAFLLSDEVVEDNGEAPLRTTPEVAITNGDFSWHASPSEQADPLLPLTLRNITLRLVPKSLTIVVGAVGSGKSSLVSALLGGIHQVAGSRCVQGDIAYVSQEAWIQHDSLRNNVLFTAPMDECKYERVLAACQLAADLKMLPNGDATEIGERGINLSGGQKARVSLARAMYRTDADVVLLDDPLSALDVHVAGAVFRDCVQGLLADKTTLLVLNSHYHFLPHADRVLVMVDGAIAADGPFDVVKEQFPHLQSFVETASEGPKESPGATAKPEAETTANGTLVEKEERQIGAVSASTYGAYIRSSRCDAVFVVATVVLSFGVAQASLAILDWFMGYWSNDASRQRLLSSAWIYAGIAVGSVLLVWGRSAYVLLVVLRCSKSLHERLFAKVLGAPVNTFFDVTPVGRILNRFSNDLDQVDSQLPFYGLLFLQFGFQIFAVVVVCAATSPYMLVLYAPLAFLFYKLQTFYNVSSGDLKRYDSVTRTPVLNLVAETIDGLSTIRAFKMTAAFAERGRIALDYNQRFFLIYRVATRWLQMRLDWLSAAIIAGVSFLSIATRASVGVTAAGLALTYAAQMSAFLSRTTMLFSFIDNIMTSVERLEHYDSLDTEGDSRVVTVTPPVVWPQAGVVQFDNYSMRYRDHLELVLRNVSFTVAGGHKVGICGRTGSGKSSLMVALFRMVEAAAGRILIDGVDLAAVDLRKLRSRLTIIPQDPVLFSGSLRFNIDPAGEASDDALWSVLKQVHLADAVGLDFVVAEKGGNLSVGQRQLLCIARALLRRSKVVVLDEATANIDLESDRLIQQTIAECFGDVTLLVIAHRLDTILDSDRILVMDRGSVQEYGAPHELLADDSSAFAQLAKQAHLMA
ncbi:ATP-binding Cassette (ABC) Superfamily [Achlya hypogyna]|uniref:ATP-binding Cassette (ABC) Superfamily n=1 Tax=Achlya hypogyna TaxID=1202772 RepID=A0A1V9YP65_ACHHY|nr:ATP-binding Cassette (ABC) Superfamily [Achlya hypogyna]